MRLWFIKFINFFMFLWLVVFSSFTRKERPFSELKIAVGIEGDSPFLIFLINNNNSDCSVCNMTLFQLHSDSLISTVIPYTDRLIITRSVREVEKKLYQDQFSYLKPSIKIVAHDGFYEYLSSLLPSNCYQGGTILVKGDSVICAYGYNNPDAYEKLIKCVSNIRP